MQLLTDVQLGEIETLLQEMTPGPYDWGIHESGSLEEAAAWETENVLKGCRTTMDMVYVGDPDPPGGSVILAMTGNGPNGPANARGIVTALRALPLLLAEVRQSRAMTTAQREGTS